MKRKKKEVEEVFDDTPEEETSEEKGTEGAPKTVFGKARKEVGLEVFYPENSAGLPLLDCASLIDITHTHPHTKKIPKKSTPNSTDYPK